MKLRLALVVSLPVLLGAALALVLAPGCGDSGDSKPSSSAGAGSTSAPAASGGGAASASSGGKSSAAAPPASAVELPPAAPGTICGLALFQGVPPERKALPGPRKEPGCGEHESDPLSERVIVHDGRLQNVFVWIARGLAADAVPPVPDDPVVLDQHGCMYQPHVTGVRTGQKLLIHNGDQTNHNVNVKPRRNQGFNRQQGKGSADIELVFTQEEVAISFACDLHPWMNAWVGAVDHPFFAITGPDGSFAIEGVPPGTYAVKAWHENWTRPKEFKNVEVTAEAGAAISFTYED